MSVHFLQTGKLCVDAIYLDKSDMISGSCDFKVTHRNPIPRIVKYQDYALVTGSTGKMLLQCPSVEVQEIEPCSTLCMIKLKCGCKLQDSHNLYVQNNLYCNENATEPEVLFGHNMAFINEYFGRVPTLWKGKSLSMQSDIVDLPEIPDSFTEVFEGKIVEDKFITDNLNYLIDRVILDANDLSGADFTPKWCSQTGQ